MARGLVLVEGAKLRWPGVTSCSMGRCDDGLKKLFQYSAHWMTVDLLACNEKATQRDPLPDSLVAFRVRLDSLLHET